jgi:hypothetical protein
MFDIVTPDQNQLALGTNIFQIDLPQPWLPVAPPRYASKLAAEQKFIQQDNDSDNDNQCQCNPNVSHYCTPIRKPAFQ